MFLRVFVKSEKSDNDSYDSSDSAKNLVSDHQTPPGSGNRWKGPAEAKHRDPQYFYVGIGMGMGDALGTQGMDMHWRQAFYVLRYDFSSLPLCKQTRPK